MTHAPIRPGTAGACGSTGRVDRENPVPAHPGGNDRRRSEGVRRRAPADGPGLARGDDAPRVRRDKLIGQMLRNALARGSAPNSCRRRNAPGGPHDASSPPIARRRSNSSLRVPAPSRRRVRAPPCSACPRRRLRARPVTSRARLQPWERDGRRSSVDDATGPPAWFAHRPPLCGADGPLLRRPTAAAPTPGEPWVPGPRGHAATAG